MGFRHSIILSQIQPEPAQSRPVPSNQAALAVEALQVGQEPGTGRAGGEVVRRQELKPGGLHGDSRVAPGWACGARVLFVCFVCVMMMMMMSSSSSSLCWVCHHGMGRGKEKHCNTHHMRAATQKLEVTSWNLVPAFSTFLFRPPS